MPLDRHALQTSSSRVYRAKVTRRERKPTQAHRQPTDTGEGGDGT